MLVNLCLRPIGPARLDGESDVGKHRHPGHQGAGRNQVLLANPVGIGLAELSTIPGKAVLRTADGKEYSDTDADLLLADLTGYPLPVSRLPDWLLGRGAANSSIEYDAQERPLQLRDSGWVIDYEYGNTTAGAHTIKVPVVLNDGRRILLGILEDITESLENIEVDSTPHRELYCYRLPG